MMESLGESTYIVPFRASRPRRISTTTNTRRRAATLEDHLHTSTSGREGSLLENELTSSSNSRTRSDSSPPLSPPQSSTTSSNIGDNIDNINSAVGHQGITTTIDAHVSLSSNPAAAALDSGSESALILVSAHWPQAQTDAELYSASLPPPPSLTATTMSTTTAATVWSGNSNISSNTIISRDNNNSDISDTITYTPKQEQEQEQVEKNKVEDGSFDPECAICLDKILPLRHAKAILACRHEFHLSCIS